MIPKLLPPALLLLASLHAQVREGLDPRGIWLQAWTGSTAGTAWVTVRDAPGDGPADAPGRYLLEDFSGRGFEFTLDASGALEILSTSGDDAPRAGSGGRFEGPDQARFDLVLDERGAHRSGLLLRAPGTAGLDPVPGPPVDGPEGLAGPWTAVGSELGPTTGRVLRERELACRVEVRGPRVRLTFPDGSYDQGLFVAPDRFLIRHVVTERREGPEAPTEVMTSTRNHDVLGLGRLVSENELELLLLLQSRGRPEDRVQLEYRYVLTR